jgi:hypothetical protein
MSSNHNHYLSHRLHYYIPYFADGVSIYTPDDENSINVGQLVGTEFS